jgi:membrane protein EpsK
VIDTGQPTESRPDLGVAEEVRPAEPGTSDVSGAELGTRVSRENGRPVRRGRFATNIAANVGALAVNLLIGFWFTPYLIHHLGVSSFGLIPLINQITGYLTIITLALNAAVGRWTTIAVQRRRYDEANRYFNASFFGSLFLIAVLAVPAVLAASNVNKLISVPADQEAQAGWLMGCALVVFFLNTLLTPFGVATYSMNRFDLRNLATISEQVVRVGVAVALFTLVTPGLWQVGLAMIAASLVGGTLNLWFWRKLTPMLRVSFAWFDIKAVGKLASFGGWISVSQVGALLFIAIDLLVVNRLFGPASGGRYAAALSWSHLLRTLAGVLGIVFGPTILYIYARNDIDGLVVYARRAMKFMGLVLALPIGLICGFSVPLLRTWLGPEYVSLAPLMSLMTVYLSVTLSAQVLFQLQQATNRVKVPGIVTLAMGAGNLGLALFLAGPAGWGLYGVAAAGAITLSARNLIFVPLYTAHVLERRAWTFYPVILLNATVAVLLAATCYLVSRFVELWGWGRLSIAVAAVSAAYLLVVWLLSSAEERALFKKLVTPRS